MIPVYVISLIDSADRRELTKRQLGELGVSFRFLDAIDARRLQYEELAAKAPGNGRDYSGMLTPQEIACALSHLSAIRRIADGPSEFGAVFEDDACFSAGVRNFLVETFLRRLPPFDILQLDGTQTPGSRRLTLPIGHFDRYELCATVKLHHSMYGLIYSKAATQKIAASLTDILAPIDNMIFKDARVPGLKIIGVRPAVVSHFDIPSVIGERPELVGLTRKLRREARRLRSWARRWISFYLAWGSPGLRGLELRKTEHRTDLVATLTPLDTLTRDRIGTPSLAEMARPIDGTSIARGPADT
jgi:GR25 family glycosyltransferase involved in LPS biosynthesis